MREHSLTGAPRTHIDQRLRPFKQGALDGLCGIYAIINALRWTAGTDVITNDLARELFRLLSDHIIKEQGHLSVCSSGIGTRHLQNLLKAATGYLHEFYEHRFSYRSVGAAQTYQCCVSGEICGVSVGFDHASAVRRPTEFVPNIDPTPAAASRTRRRAIAAPATEKSRLSTFERDAYPNLVTAAAQSPLAVLLLQVVRPYAHWTVVTDAQPIVGKELKLFDSSGPRSLALKGLKVHRSFIVSYHLAETDCLG